MCLFAIKLFEDHGIRVDRAELLSLSVCIYACVCGWRGGVVSACARVSMCACVRYIK